MGEEKEDNVRHRGAEAYLFETEYTEEERTERAARLEAEKTDEDLEGWMTDCTIQIGKGLGW